MNLTLERKEFKKEGIFGELHDSEGNLIAYTLEHSYDGIPKVLAGEYECTRHPPARLNYETFMLENVPAFKGREVSGILIHKGNFNKDSEGCILVGCARKGDMVTDSKIAFERLMGLQKDLKSFKLKIEE